MKAFLLVIRSPSMSMSLGIRLARVSLLGGRSGIKLGAVFFALGGGGFLVRLRWWPFLVFLVVC
jgi:hypothetical protein